MKTRHVIAIILAIIAILDVLFIDTVHHYGSYALGLSALYNGIVTHRNFLSYPTFDLLSAELAADEHENYTHIYVKGYARWENERSLTKIAAICYYSSFAFVLLSFITALCK